MKLKDTKINIGGLMRCCLETIETLNPDYELKDGMIIDCKYEHPGNKQIILQNGVWRWNG